MQRGLVQSRAENGISEAKVLWIKLWDLVGRRDAF